MTSDLPFYDLKTMALMIASTNLTFLSLLILSSGLCATERHPNDCWRADPHVSSMDNPRQMHHSESQPSNMATVTILSLHIANIFPAAFSAFSGPTWGLVDRQIGTYLKESCNLRSGADS